MVIWYVISKVWTMQSICESNKWFPETSDVWFLPELWWWWWWWRRWWWWWWWWVMVLVMMVMMVMMFMTTVTMKLKFRFWPFSIPPCTTFEKWQQSRASQMPGTMFLRMMCGHNPSFDYLLWPLLVFSGLNWGKCGPSYLISRLQSQFSVPGSMGLWVWRWLKIDTHFGIMTYPLVN